MKLEIISFSYKVGLPPQHFSWDESRHGGGFVFDCRAVPNPGRLPEFKTATGKDKAVGEYIESKAESRDFWTSSSGLVIAAVKNYLERDFTFLSVAYGCTGGQHRSVYFAEKLASEIKSTFGSKVEVTLRHFNLEKK